MKEIVIKIHDIPQNDHERWALKNGTILPKGHGDLIDREALYDQYMYADYDFDKTVEYAPTIIEADGGEKDDR